MLDSVSLVVDHFYQVLLQVLQNLQIGFASQMLWHRQTNLQTTLHFCINKKQTNKKHQQQNILSRQCKVNTRQAEKKTF